MILGMGSANERTCYYVLPSLNGEPIPRIICVNLPKLYHGCDWWVWWLRVCVMIVISFSFNLYVHNLSNNFQWWNLVLINEIYLYRVDSNWIRKLWKTIKNFFLIINFAEMLPIMIGVIHPLASGQNDFFPDDIFKCVFLTKIFIFW